MENYSSEETKANDSTQSNTDYPSREFKDTLKNCRKTSRNGVIGEGKACNDMGFLRNFASKINLEELGKKDSEENNSLTIAELESIICNANENVKLKNLEELEKDPHTFLKSISIYCKCEDNRCKRVFKEEITRLFGLKREKKTKLRLNEIKPVYYTSNESEVYISSELFAYKQSDVEEFREHWLEYLFNQ